MINTASGPRRIGAIFDRARPPEDLAGFARALEDLGADDLWVVEDLRWAGAVTSAATALAATDRLRVGIGICPAPLRNPALLAMEVGTLARIHPGRLVAGVGHGATAWMREVGALVPNRLDLLAETVTAVRQVVRGHEVTVDGQAIHLERMRLVHPPSVPPPVIVGVIGPRSLELSGRVADGTLVVEGRGPDDLPGIRALIERGRATRDQSEDRPGSHELLVFTHLALDDDPDAVSAALAPILDEYSEFLGVPLQDVFTVSGDKTQVAQRTRALWNAGADSVILRPVGEDPLGQVTRALEALRQG
ncbi:MAG TPA: LLM class flavin-dependent oxidoreductase [Actinocrinis sp.]|uniref:LLM class flavin-dependent oxidoreductase n=1 Tax=Actinocrinis sp. TaxID=1920516 RepID=UPI002DDCF966|nr:LLM class flavin-dependent oxidoreductase [Actinocrinis sp.]HEV3170779.1 LLM class flavin-dependent oxidoreductase [Actinocrinis sp.]